MESFSSASYSKWDDDRRLGQPDRLSSTDYSKLDYDRAWSSQEWKAEATTYDRSGQPDKISWE